MKAFFVVIASVLLVSVFSEDHEDCEMLGTPSFTLKYGEGFVVPEACLIIKCRGKQTFEISSNCPILFRGAPSDFAAKKNKEIGDKILAGKACTAMSAE